MKKFAHLIKSIIPTISHICPMDDGSLYVVYDNGQKQTILSTCDYEDAVRQKQKIDGLRDRVLGLC